MVLLPVEVERKYDHLLRQGGYRCDQLKPRGTSLVVQW